MRPMQVFWGLVIILIGLIFLGVNFGWWDGIAWERIWQLWPLILIALGLRSIIRNDFGFLFALIVLLAVGALAITTLPVEVRNSRSSSSFMRHWGFGESQKLSGEKQQFTQSLAVTATDKIEIDLNGRYEVTITGNDSSTVSVDLNGPKEITQELTLEKSGNTVRLQGKNSGFRFGLILNDEDVVTGTITLPKVMAAQLKLSGLSNVTIRDYQGALEIDASGASQVTSENSTIMNPDIDLSGAGKISLDNCQGNGRIELSGAGKITANSCTLGTLTVRTSGAGEVDIKAGTVTDLDAEVSGAGRIKVPKPSGKIEQDTSGAGNVSFY